MPRDMYGNSFGAIARPPGGWGALAGRFKGTGDYKSLSKFRRPSQIRIKSGVKVIRPAGEPSSFRDSGSLCALYKGLFS